MNVQHLYDRVEELHAHRTTLLHKVRVCEVFHSDDLGKYSMQQMHVEQQIRNLNHHINRLEA